MSYAGLMLAKNYPWTRQFDKAIGLMRAGGLIDHFFNEPIPLEMTMDPKIFTYVDDSKEKLTLETFFLIFIIWGVGMGLGLVSLASEKIFFERDRKRQMAKRKQRLAS